MDYRRSSIHPRASVFAGRPSVLESSSRAPAFLSALEAAIEATENCGDILEDAVEEISLGTRDLPRLSKVMHTSRLFTLIDENLVRQMKEDVSSEVEPQVKQLIGRAESALRGMEKQEAMLHSKLESLRQPATVSNTTSIITAKHEARKAKMLANQRQRLERELAILEGEIEDLEKQVDS
ncbi:hypothetical protein BOTBODRAFT_169765 [Botryobasidium botryosum FD-172 SS1]|uniref:DASH complex subunit SPC19 n=1 Tax=Botryobasidium botryosum (strain FD-172 SS1) TaxID=930990 RepID=A0A067NAF2_BOTB1|nr:hypothetical protein BOTBODRAFT_169765 [Botryobasidium botryosum FD-172 SS1]